jgi:hypothetical protein
MRNPFSLDDQQAEEWKQKFRELAQAHVDEEVIAAGPFRRGGAASQYALSKAGGGLPYAIGSLINKKRAGGLPSRVFLVVTPTKLHAFNFGVKGRSYKLKKEAAVWERAGLRIATERKSGLTMLTIESPAEGEKATLAPGGVSDDPLTGEVISVLQGGATAGSGAG